MCVEVIRILHCLPEEGRKETTVNTYHVTSLWLAACYLRKVLFSTSET